MHIKDIQLHLTEPELQALYDIIGRHSPWLTDEMRNISAKIRALHDRVDKANKLMERIPKREG